MMVVGLHLDSHLRELSLLYDVMPAVTLAHLYSSSPFERHELIQLEIQYIHHISIAAWMLQVLHWQCLRAGIHQGAYTGTRTLVEQLDQQDMHLF